MARSLRGRPTAVHDLVELLPGLSEPRICLASDCSRSGVRLRDAFVAFINEVILRRLTPPDLEPPRISRLVEVPTMLEQRIDRWTRNWERQGWQKGLQEGRREGEASVVLRQLERRYAPLPPWVEHRVCSANAEQILVWADRILTAKSLDEIFAEQGQTPPG